MYNKRMFNKIKICFNKIKNYICIVKIKLQIMNVKLPVVCPSCAQMLSVSELTCASCSTKVSGNFALPVLLSLSEEEQNFILEFFLSSGSLKEMAQKLGNSYPTVRNKLDDLIEKVKNTQNK